MEKLVMHHNNLGPNMMDLVGLAVSKHPSIVYIDISSNHLGTHGFIDFYGKVNTRSSKLLEFHCRDNKIGGEELMGKLNGISKQLTVLDLQNNELDDENGAELLEYSQKNIFIE